MKTKRLVIVIKLGSALLTDGKGKINRECIAEVCRQVARLTRLGHHALIITSGAIASDQHRHRSDNLRAAVGQPKIMEIYTQFFDAYGLEVAQLLLTDEQLIGGQTKVTKAVISEAFRENVVCVINANDVIDDEETKALKHCADNDILMSCVCRMLGADLVIIAFTEAGVLDNHGQVIPEVRPADLVRVMAFAKGGHKFGHGKNGMLTKIETLGALAADGVTSILAPGKQENFILRAFNHELNFGTKFIAEPTTKPPA